MGILYFDVEANYEELIELRKQITGLEKQMAEVGVQGAAALEPLEKKYAVLSARIETLTSQAAISGQKIQSAYNQMGKISTGLSGSTQKTSANAGQAGKAMAQGVIEADSAAEIFQDTLSGVNKGLGKTLNMMNGLGSTIGTAFGVGAIGMFLNKVQEVRTYFQDIESSMRVFLGDAEKANQFTEELKSYAYYNMFEFSELAGGAKQLIAYGHETEKIIPIMDKLSNVAAGTGASLNELIGLYNKAKSTGSVMARDVQSWAAKGVVLRDELKAMGVQAATGAITFNQLNQVLERVTGEGGRFHNLMAEQMNNLSASKGQFQDSIDAMYNEIGEKMQPLLKGTIDLANWAAENYDTVGKAILSLASAYGIYRAALGITHALEVIHQKDEERRLVTAKAALAVANGQAKTMKEAIALLKGEAQANREVTATIMEKVKARQMEMVLEKKALLSERGSLNKSLKLTRTSLSNSDKERKLLKQQETDLLAKGVKDNDSALKSVRRKLKENQDTYVDLLEKESSQENRKIEIRNKLKEINGQLLETEEANNEFIKEDIKHTTLLGNVKENLIKKLLPLKAALTNPYVLALAAMALVVVSIYKIATALPAEEKGYRAVTDELERYTNAMKERKEESDIFINQIKDETKSLYEQIDAYEKLIALYPFLEQFSMGDIKKMDKDKLQQMVAGYENDQQAEMLQRRLKAAEEERDKQKGKVDKGSDYYAYTGSTIAVSSITKGEEQKLEELQGKVRGYQEQVDKYWASIRESQLKGLEHADRKEVLESDKKAAEDRLAVWNTFQEKIKEMNEKGVDTTTRDLTVISGLQSEMSKADAKITDLKKAKDDANAKLESAKAEYISLQHDADATDEDRKKALEAQKEAEKELLTISGQLKQSESLFTELQETHDKLQDALDKTPLQFAFSFDYDLDAMQLDILKGNKKNIEKGGASKATIKNFVSAFNDILADTSMSEETRATQIDDLYAQTIETLQTQLTDIKDDDKKAVVRNMVSRLMQDRRNGQESFLNSDLTQFMEQGSKGASKEVRVATDALTTEQAKYIKYTDQIQDATQGYHNALAAYKDMQQRYLNGEEIKEEEKKNVLETLNTAKNGYEALLKEGNRYNKMRETQRQYNIEKERKSQDVLYSIRENEIKAMRDGADKSIAQVRLDFERRNTEIQRSYEDLRETWVNEQEKLYNANPDNVSEAFDREAIRKKFRYTDKQTEDRDAQVQANTIEYIRKLDELSKSSQTSMEKKTEQRRKAEQDILTITKSIEEIENNIDLKQTEEGQRAIENLKKRLELAKEIAEQLNFNKDKADYYKQYGTAWQKKESISQDYENQIKLAEASGEDEWVISKLQKDRDRELAKADYEALSKSMDWYSALSTLSNAMPKVRNQMLARANAITENEQFRNLDAKDQQAVLEMIDQIKDGLNNSLSEISFKDVRDNTNAYRIALKNLLTVEAEHIRIMNDANATDEQRKESQEKYEQAERDVIRTQHAANSSLEGTVGAIDNFAEGLSKLSSDSLAGIWEGIQMLYDSFSDIGDIFSEATDDISEATSDVAGAIGESGGEIADATSDAIDGLSNGASAFGVWGKIIGAILKLIDVLADKGLGQIVSQLLDKIGDAVEKLLEDILSGDIFSQIIGGIVNLVTKIIDGIGSSVSKWIGVDYDPIQSIWGDGTKDFENLLEQTMKLSDAFATAREEILKDWNKKTAEQAAKDAEKVKAQNEQEIAEWRKTGLRWGTTGASWKSHSHGWNWWNGLDDEVRASFNAIGVEGVTTLMNLSVEQMRNLRSMPTLWQHVDESLQGYINNIIKADDDTQKLVDDVAEKFLNLSFDDMANSFLSTMMDIEKTAYDTADDIAKIFYESMVTDAFNKKYREQLETLYEKMAKARENGNETEIEGLKKEYNDLVKDFQNERNLIASQVGYDKSYAANQASSRGFQAMSQDVGNELNGRFTALQLSGEQIKGYQQIQTESLLPALSAKIDTLVGLIGGDAANPISHIISDVQTTLNNSYLELQAINGNTAAVMDYWAKNGELRRMLETIKNNTNKIKG